MPGRGTDPSSPARLLGEFHVLAQIGAGGMGVVYEAVQPSLNRRVAVKVLRGGALLDDRATERFRQEAQAIARLRHPHIIEVYAFGVQDGTHYYAMQLLEGVSLGTTIHGLQSGVVLPAGPFDPTGYHHHGHDPSHAHALTKSHGSSAPLVVGSGRHRTPTAAHPAAVVNRRYVDAAVGMIAEVADALQHAHDHHVVHRDIKPSNLLLAGPGRLVVADFGLAIQADAESLSQHAGAVAGTPLYMSPEQAVGGRIDHRTDIYSLGVTLYELLTLHHPFEDLAATAARTDGRRAYKPRPWDEPPSFRHFGVRLPRDLELVVTKAVHPDPARRYPTAAEFAADLRRFLNYEAVSVKPPGLVETARRWTRRHRRKLLAATLLVLVAAGLAAYAGWDKSRRVSRHTDEGFALLEKAKAAPDADAEAGLDAARAEFAAARALDPTNPRAEAGLLDIQMDRCERALRAGAFEAARGMVPALDQLDRTGANAERIAAFRRRAVGTGTWQLTADAPKSQVALTRLGPDYRPGPPEDIGTAPVARRDIPMGNYLVTVGRPGYTTVRYPLRVERNEETSVAVRMVKTTDVPTGMVYVPAGEFLGRDQRTGTDRRVPLDGYFLDGTEVTCAEYQVFLADPRNQHIPPPDSWDGSRHCPPGWDRSAVFNVTWFDAWEYARWAGKRLPTEQEWEKAARGVDGRQYPWGDVFEAYRCNSRETRQRAGLATRQFAAGESLYGCHDMAGNVWEWTATRDRPGSAARVIRGGAAACSADQLLAWRRQSSPPRGSDAGGLNLLGFRCARSVVPEPVPEVFAALAGPTDLGAACDLLVRRRDLARVQECAGRLLKLNPRSAVGNYWLGCCRLLEGNAAGAVGPLTIVMGQRPAPSAEQIEMLVGLLRSSAATRELQQAFALPGLLRQAEDASRGDNPTATRAALDAVLRLDPDNEVAHDLLIDVCYAARVRASERWWSARNLSVARDGAEAARLSARYQELIRARTAEDPQNPSLHADAAIGLAKHGRRRPEALAAARGYAERAVALDPEDPEGYYALASVRFIQGELEGARDAARRALALNPTVEAYQRQVQLIEARLPAKR